MNYNAAMYFTSTSVSLHMAELLKVKHCPAFMLSID